MIGEVAVPPHQLADKCRTVDNRRYVYPGISTGYRQMTDAHLAETDYRNTENLLFSHKITSAFSGRQWPP
jgi:hypothetical protein